MVLGTENLAVLDDAADWSAVWNQHQRTFVRHTFGWFMAVVSMLAASGLLLSVPTTMAAEIQAVRLVKYEVRLYAAEGEPVADGARAVIVSLYDRPDFGTRVFSACTNDGTALGTPTPALLHFVSGRATAVLGNGHLRCVSGHPVMGGVTAADPLWVGVTVGDGAEMAPRSFVFR